MAHLFLPRHPVVKYFIAVGQTKILIDLLWVANKTITDYHRILNEYKYLNLYFINKMFYSACYRPPPKSRVGNRHHNPPIIVPKTAVGVANLPTFHQHYPYKMQKNRSAYVIENDHITAVVTELILRKNLLRSEVRNYVNGHLAFDQLTEDLRAGAGAPDLILLDLDMPVMDGWEFLDALSGLHIARQVCVFVLTSSIHPDDMERAKRYREVKGFFSKPLRPDGVAWMQHFLQLADASSQAWRLGAGRAPAMPLGLSPIVYTT